MTQIRWTFSVLALILGLLMIAAHAQADGLYSPSGFGPIPTQTDPWQSPTPSSSPSPIPYNPPPAPTPPKVTPTPTGPDSSPTPPLFPTIGGNY